MIHRDVKPSNILLDRPRPEIKLFVTSASQRPPGRLRSNAGPRAVPPTWQ